MTAASLTRQPTATAASGIAGLIILCAANNYDAVKVADHHMAERLAARVPVLYVDPPLSRLSPVNDPMLAAALEGPRLRRIADGFWRLTPVMAPFPMRSGMRAVTERLVKRALRRAVASIGLPVDAVISAWPRLDVFGGCGERRRVWWAQDDFAAGAALMGQNPEAVAAGEAARAQASDLIVAANPEVAARWQGIGRPVALIPYGADPGSFADVGRRPPDDELRIASPVAALVGQLNERVQADLLFAVADRGTSILLVGPEARTGADWLAELAARPNVQWVGAQPFTALPAFLAHASVGLVPYADTPFNRASFPLKLLEYLAAGLPVVTTGLPASRWLAAPTEHVAIADDPRGFSDAVAALAARPLTAALRKERRVIAARHSWDARAEALLDAVASCEPRA